MRLHVDCMSCTAFSSSVGRAVVLFLRWFVECSHNSARLAYSFDTSIRYGSDKRPSLLDCGNRALMVLGAECAGCGSGMTVGSTAIKQTLSMKSLKETRCEVRKAFIGSIQYSFDPNVAMLASVCSDLAISVNDRLDCGGGSTVLISQVLDSRCI